MPRFAFEARDADGGRVRGFETAADLLDLDRRLDRSGLLLIDARPARRARGRSSDRALIDFCYHLSVAGEAGIPLLEALEDLRAGSSGAFGDALADVARKLESGSSLADALAERPQDFPKLMRSLVRAGESTGRLEQILADLVKYLEWREELQRQVRRATAYPITVMLGVAALGAIVMGFVLPAFLDIFVELRVPLPLGTRLLIALQSFLARYGLYLLGAGGAVAALGVATLRTEAGRRIWDGWSLRLPIMGRLIRMIECSRLCHNLGVLYAAGLPIAAALELVKDVVQNRRFAAFVGELRQRIARGESLADALSREDFMPPLVARMVSIGEASGRLDEALDRVAGFFDREVPVVISRTLAWFNTGALVLLGGALLGVVLSLFVPLYAMMGSLDAAP